MRLGLTSSIHIEPNASPRPGRDQRRPFSRIWNPLETINGRTLLPNNVLCVWIFYHTVLGKPFINSVLTDRPTSFAAIVVNRIHYIPIRRRDREIHGRAILP